MTGETGAVCIDDAMEPNDTLASALPSTGGTAVACLASPDVWSLEVGPDGTVEVAVSFVHAEGDLDVRLLDAAGAVLDAAETASDTETVAWVNTTGAPAPLFVEIAVWEGSPSPSNAYDWVATVTECTDDAFEPNDDGVSAATGIAASESLVMASDGVDVFAVEVPGSTEIAVTADHVPLDADLDLRLYDATGTVQLDASTTAQPRERVRWFNATGADATVLVRVDRFAWTRPCTPYTLTHALTSYDCTDPTEEDDTPAQAAPIAVGSVTNGFATAGDEDWLSFTVPAGTAVRAELVGSPGVATGLALFDDAATQLTDAVWANDTGADATIYARITGLGGACGPWELTVSEATPACAPDLHEPDDTPATAGPLVSGVANVTVLDDDFHATTLDDGHRLVISAEAEAALGSLELAMSDLTGTPLDFDGAAPYDLAVTNTTGAALPLLVGIGNATPTLGCLPYALDVLDIDCAADDALEDDDDPASATPVASASDLWSSDDDWFALGTVPVGAEVRATVVHRVVVGDLDAELLDASGAVLAAGTSVEDDETVVWVNPGPGPADVLLRVHPWVPTGCATPYAMESAITLP